MKRTNAVFFALIFAISALFAFMPAGAGAETKRAEALTAETETVSGLQTPPIAIADVKTADALSSLKGDDKPVQAILTVGEGGGVIGEKGEKLCDLFVALNEYLGESILPVFRVSPSFADAFIAAMASDERATDASVMSSSPETVKKVKEAFPLMRGIVEFDENADMETVVPVANGSLAQICVLPEAVASYDNVRYVQARFKTVWVKAGSDGRMSIKNCVASGCYGVIAESASAVNGVLREYEGGISRTPFNSAHRGLPEKYNENSVSGTLAAVEAGATHVELDCYLTKDKEIVFMHDANLARTSTGTGNIEDYTSAELNKFRLKQISDEKIPYIEDIAGALEKSDAVLILEIKTNNPDFADVLKEKLSGDLAWLKNRMVVISFDGDQLGRMSEVLPGIPAGDLNGKTSQTIEEILGVACRENRAIDYNFAALDKTKNKRLIARGIIPWTWTYNGEVTVVNGLETGIPAMTNNNADALSLMPEKIAVLPETDKVPEIGGSIKIEVTEYGGGTKIAEGKVTDVAPAGDGTYEVIAEYDPAEDYYISAVMYTQKQTVTVKSKKRGCGASAGSGFAPLAFASAVFAIRAEKKRKRKQ